MKKEYDFSKAVPHYAHIPRAEILVLLVSAEDYGYHDLIPTFVKWLDPIKKELSLYYKQN